MQTKGIKVVYDMSTIPDGITLDNLYNILKESGILIWDSSKGFEPKIITDENIKLMDLRFLSKEEINEKFNNYFED